MSRDISRAASDTLVASVPLSDPIDVFNSCSPADDALRTELEKHLTILQRRSAIRAWKRGRVEAGEALDAEVTTRHEAARVLLLLVSADDLADDLADEASWSEVKRALERHRSDSARHSPYTSRVRLEAGALRQVFRV